MVKDLIPHSVCDQLALPLHADAQRVLESGFWPPQPERGIFGQGHVQLGLPRCAPWVHADVVANEVIEQVVAAGVGTGAAAAPTQHLTELCHGQLCWPPVSHGTL